jgi:hypothetical protein
MTLANAPLSARDARLNASDLPDGTSEIFLQTRLDTRQSQGRSDLPVGHADASSPVLIENRALIEPA